MSQKYKRKVKNQQLQDIRVSTATKNLNLRGLQIECVLRGMDFEEIQDSSILNLHSWLIKNWDNPIHRHLVDDYDKWLDAELEAIGREDLIHPTLNLGSTQKSENGDIVKRKIRQVNPEKKKKRERTSEGIFKGTKKAYTYELAKQGIPKDQAIEMVIEKFPEAKDKSISIWYNKAKKLL